MDEQLQRGVDYLQTRIEGSQLLLSKIRTLGPVFSSHYVAIASKGALPKQTEIVLSYEFLTDLPQSNEQQQALDEYLAQVRKRLLNPFPDDFQCRSGIPISIEVHWPFQATQRRPAEYVHVVARDLRKPGEVAKCTAILERFPPKPTPFEEQEWTVNSIRRAIDQQLVNFFPEREHPNELQSVEIEPEGLRGILTAAEIEEFLLQKVYWLAFRRGDKTTASWILDPWDVAYLGVELIQVRQARDILEAKNLTELSMHREFASAGREMLLRSQEFERRLHSVGADTERPSWPRILEEAHPLRSLTIAGFRGFKNLQIPLGLNGVCRGQRHGKVVAV